jgi:hypothetical protein
MTTTTHRYRSGDQIEVVTPTELSGGMMLQPGSRYTVHRLTDANNEGVDLVCIELPQDDFVWLRPDCMKPADAA